MSRLVEVTAAPSYPTGRSPASTASLRLLPWASSGVDVLPGVPARVRQLADELDAVAHGLARVRGLVTRTPHGDWWGPAAGLFDQLLDQQPARYGEAARAMSSGACALRSHAAVLAAAQSRADDAVRLDLLAAAATGQWLRSSSGAHLVGGPGDPGAAARTRVSEEIRAVRHQVATSAASTSACLRDGARAAPDRPVLPVRAVRSVLGFGRGVREGMTETVVDTLALAVRFSSVRLLSDPAGYVSDAADMGVGAADALSHPGSLAATVLDVETLRHDPGRWVGHLLPDAALAVGTAGAVPVAERGAGVAVRAAARVGPSGVRTPLRQAIDAQVATGRSPLRLRDLRAYRGEPDPFGHRARLTPVDHAVAHRVLRDSRWAEHHITPRLEAVSRDVATWVGPSADRDVGLQGLDHALKDPDSLKRKLALEGSSTGQAVPVLSSRVNDTVRYALTVPHDGYVESATFTADRMAGQGFRLSAVKSFWESDRYRGLNLTFHDPATGRPFELQMHTPDSWAATVETHPDYSSFRSPAIPAVLKEFYRRRIEARFAIVPVPDGVGRLGLALQPSGGRALMATPLLRTVADLGGGARLGAGVHGARALAWEDNG